MKRGIILGFAGSMDLGLSLEVVTPIFLFTDTFILIMLGPT